MRFQTLSMRRNIPGLQNLSLTLSLYLLVSCGGSSSPKVPSSPTPPISSPAKLIPIPINQTTGEGEFTLTKDTKICVLPGSDELKAIGQYLANKLNPSTGLGIAVIGDSSQPSSGNILLTTNGADPLLGDEGYALTAGTAGIEIRAPHPAGLFRGIQTLRQLLPARAEAATIQDGPWTVNAVAIRDMPRFPWRGAMLDVSRHFFSVDDVKHYMDLLAAYKINVFHLHLSDDQGWRLEIHSRPQLTSIGSSTEVGGGPGGFYTQAQYADLLAYAKERYITLIPEFEMPGHCNAALASYAELNCDGISPDLYTGIEVGFSSLCVGNEATYAFVNDVVSEVAPLAPGGILHIGGDEAHSTTDVDYLTFMTRVSTILKNHQLTLMGWDELSKTSDLTNVIVQHYLPGDPASAQLAVSKGAKLVLSPADRAYLDMKYNANTVLGLSWAGYVEVPTAYEWDPLTIVPGIAEDQILGVEGPLWTETLETRADLEYMAFPRVCGLAELGWATTRPLNWNEYKYRLAAQADRLYAMQVNYYRSPEVPW